MTAPAACRLDHLVVVAPDLETGRAWAEERLGVPPSGGRQHPQMGTHNLLWGLGPAEARVYLEVIAVDPHLPHPDRPRWFGLDDPADADHLRSGPWLATWAALTDDLEGLSARAPVPLDPPMAMSRGALRWEVAIPRDAPLPLGGAWPLLIRRPAGSPHASAELDTGGLTLLGLEVAGPHAAAVAEALGSVEGPVSFLPAERATRISARIATPRGEILL